MKKSTKRVTVTSEAKNDKGFRVRTAGIDVSGYEKNPIMLLMHQRPKGLNTDEVGVIGNVIELTFEDTKLKGIPAFDDTDPFAMKLFNKFENGTMRMVSAGLLPILFAKDANGEIWLEKSKLIEISLVDIGSNPEALAVALYNENEELITLTLEEITNNLKPETDMKLIQLNADVLPSLKLADGATADDVQKAIGNLVTLAAENAEAVKVKELEIVKLTTEAADFKEKYEAGVKLANDAKITALVDGAVAERKIVEGEKANFIKLASADFDTTKSLIDGMKSAPTVASQMKEGEPGEDLAKLSWKELEGKGKLITLKAQDLPLFKEKFKAEFNVEYKEHQ
jgi:hypothetical protein